MIWSSKPRPEQQVAIQRRALWLARHGHPSTLHLNAQAPEFADARAPTNRKAGPLVDQVRRTEKLAHWLRGRA